MSSGMSKVKRRTCLVGMLAAVAGMAKAQSGAGKPATRPIQLHLDLAVDAAKEQAFLDHFDKVFLPTARRQPGFIDLKMLKLRSAIEGPPPSGGKYRFVLTFVSEELRQKWIASKDHATAWPGIEEKLTNKKFGILLYDVY